MNNNHEEINYHTLIDAQTWRFIEKTGEWFPPDAVDLSVERQREIYNAMCREFYQGHAPGIVSSDRVISARAADDGRDAYPVPLRRYCSSSPDNTAVVVYLHGGGFVVGGLDSHDDVCSEICQSSGFDVYSVDYRLSPEHVHPAAFNDALMAVETIAAERSLPIVLCGDSAGANLAAAVAHDVRGRKIEVAGQLLIYPGLGGDMTNGSYVSHAHAPMLTTRDVLFYATVRTANEPVLHDPTYAPLQDTDFTNLPPTVIVSAECDPLSDDGRDYRDAIIGAGGQAVWINEKGLVHGYLRARSSVARARQSFDRILQGIAMLGHRQWHY